MKTLIWLKIKVFNQRTQENKQMQLMDPTRMTQITWL